MVIELYSRRIKNEQGEPEIYTYDAPIEFRNQLFYCLCDVADIYNSIKGCIDGGLWKYWHNQFAREKGLKSLYLSVDSYKNNIEYYLIHCDNIDLIDFVDFSFRLMLCLKGSGYAFDDYDKAVNDAIDELNLRFKQHNMGYEFVDRQVIRKDNEFIHQKIIKPALRLLVDNEFEGAEEEFQNAFESYEHGDNKSAIVNALKAFESTMKAICSKKGYHFDPAKAAAKDLINILENNEFYPKYMTNHLSSLRTSLESGLPTLRNKTSGHGQGEEIVEIPNEFAEYALNLAATNINLLVKIYQGGLSR